MKHLSNANVSSEDYEPPPKVIKLSDNCKDLLKFSQEQCEFCEKLCFCRYDLLVHNAKHIIIPLKDDIVQCKECRKHFASAMDLDIHTKIHHFKVPDILESIVLTKPVVQCDNSLTELVIQNTERKLEKILHKKAVVECDSTIKELIIEKNTEKLKSFVTKQPIIRCEDTLRGLLVNGNTESEIFKPDILHKPKDTILNTENEKLKTDLLKMPQVVIKKNEYELVNGNTESEICKPDISHKPNMTISNTTCEKLKTDLLKMPQVVLKKNDFSPKHVVDVKPKDLDSKSEKITKNYLKCKDIMPIENNKLVNKTNESPSIRSRLLFEDDDSDFEDDIINTNAMSKFNNLMTINTNTGLNNDIRTSKNNVNNDICDLTLDDSDDDDKKQIQLKLQLDVNKMLNDSRHMLDDSKHMLNDSKCMLNESKSMLNDPKHMLNDSNLMLNESKHISHDEITEFGPAVHYEELTEPCVWECKRCEASFYNRFDLIMHETTLHLHINQRLKQQRIRVCPACDRCVVGNHWTLKRHLEEMHPNYENECNKTIKKCAQCSLRYYRYVKHCNNYHLIYKCKKCTKAFEKETQLTEHIPVCKGIFESHQSQPVPERVGMEKIIKVCELCCLFFKNTQNYKYVTLRDYSKQGIRITCERCDKQFFEVKLIKLINRHPIAQPSYEYHRKSAPATTNEKRLLNIKRRLKLMNKLR